ncbi:threonine synthase [Hydrotalea sp.]|uniref:threonine synthase n=1 Tax=Hydrotalea sp. TaxID=2881279 RepID=UPI00260A8A69|nr:threonine synthase [Hydrotalea sp.]
MKTEIETISTASYLTCSNCGKIYDIQRQQTFAHCCNQPLITHYNNNKFTKVHLKNKPNNLWRYAAMLPVFDNSNIISLEEGFTPMHTLHKIPAKYAINHLYIKDEGGNPTGSFKARGLSVAISKAKELGIEHCIIPTAGNAGGAMSAYCAKAGIKATVVMPKTSAQLIKEEVQLLGGQLIEVNGFIQDCGKRVQQIAAETGAFDMSTMKEPYRLEGKKTLGYEIAEQFNWQLPDVIIYPTGGGTGLIGMWKAFEELQQMQWLTSNKKTRMVIVQTENCNPMIQMIEKGKKDATFQPAYSIANGLVVPTPFAEKSMLRVIAESNGTGIVVSETDIQQSIREMARTEGLLLSPEGAAAFAGFKKLAEKKWIEEQETVCIVNTGSWYKYH